jgi:hypothetical protein
MELNNVNELEKRLEGALSAIIAFKVHPSEASSKTIREQTKLVDNITVLARKELVAFDKQLISDKDN